MASISTCSHENTVLDVHEGHYVCSLCGLVTSPYFTTKQDEFHNEIGVGDIWYKEACDILDRINIPVSYCEKVIRYLNSHFEKKDRESLIFSIYKVVNDQFGVCLSLHELCNTCGINKTKVCCKQKVNENVSIDKITLVEKYYTLLGLSYQTTSLIKEELSNKSLSGHAPLTIIAGTIYQVCKRLKLKITVKKVASATSISQISIQRFCKYDNSPRR